MDLLFSLIWDPNFKAEMILFLFFVFAKLLEIFYDFLL
jgi:hypothetical protein